MIDFGYTINTGRQIDFEKNDMSVLRSITEAEPGFRLCIACGTCTATCSTGAYTSFNIRKLFTYIKRGEYSEAKTEINKCMLCGKCILACPRGVNTRNVILQIQKLL